VNFDGSGEGGGHDSLDALVGGMESTIDGGEILLGLGLELLDKVVDEQGGSFFRGESLLFTMNCSRRQPRRGSVDIGKLGELIVNETFGMKTTFLGSSQHHDETFGVREGGGRGEEEPDTVYHR
jgi:hypothetical protein